MANNQIDSGTLPTKFCSISEFGRSIGIGEGLARLLIKNGKVPTVKIGRRTLIPVASIDRLVEELISSREIKL